MFGGIGYEGQHLLIMDGGGSRQRRQRNLARAILGAEAEMGATGGASCASDTSGVELLG